MPWLWIPPRRKPEKETVVSLRYGDKTTLYYTEPTNKMPPITKSINEELKKLCPRKWLMLFSLKFQKNNQPNALAIEPADGKAGEKDCIFTALWR